MKIISFLIFFSIVLNSYADDFRTIGTLKVFKKYEIIKKSVSVVCLMTPDTTEKAEGETIYYGVTYHFKEAKDSKLNKKFYTYFGPNVDCDDESGNENIKLVRAPDRNNKKQIEQIIAESGGYDELEVVFYKEIEAEKLSKKLQDVLENH